MNNMSSQIVTRTSVGKDGIRMQTVLANTDMIALMLQHGIIPRLPDVDLDGEKFEGFQKLYGPENDIVSVEYDGDEEVQCIEIDNPEHLYVTDDYIPTHNTSNIIFLKSTDDAMIETLVKMSGTTHQAFMKQKTVTQNLRKLFHNSEENVSYVLSTEEIPVISYNDFAYIGERNAIVFRAGDSPIWNKNQLILPMSWRLFSNTIKSPGHDYTLQTIPTLSSAIDFDIKQNQPDFQKLLDHRMEQALHVDKAIESYKEAFGYSDDDINRLDMDIYAADIMDMINAEILNEKMKQMSNSGNSDPDDDDYDPDDLGPDFDPSDLDGGLGVLDGVPMSDDPDVMQAHAKEDERLKLHESKVYAHARISRADLVSIDGHVNHRYDTIFIDAYKIMLGDFQHDPLFSVAPDGSLCSENGAVVYIEHKDKSEDLQRLENAAQDLDSRVYDDGEPADSEDLDRFASYFVTDDFYKFLVELPSWKNIVNGRFEEYMYERALEDEE